MYRWSNGLAQVDCNIPELDSLLAEITEGCRTDMEKIRNTYAWVQQNIRYIAFEAGILGHKPDTPAEVLRKRYGDCKGMAILLRTLLKAQGFDARLTDIGTVDIPYRMSEIATLASVNHMICSLIYQGKTYYLDAIQRIYKRGIHTRKHTRKGSCNRKWRKLYRAHIAHAEQQCIYRQFVLYL